MTSQPAHSRSAFRPGCAGRAALLFAGLLLGAPAAWAGAGHTYEVRIGPKVPGTLRIRISLQDVPDGEVRLARAEREQRPGRRGTEFSRPLAGLRVTDAAGKPLPCDTSASRYWVVRPQGARALQVSYEVSPWFTGKDDEAALLFDPRDVLLYWVGHEGDPARIRFQLPRGWKAACGLKSGKAAAGAFEAPDLETLFDNPVLLGPLHRTDFKVKGVTFSLVFHRRPEFDPHAVTATLKRIVQYQLDLFGVKPFDRYAFLVLLREERPWPGATDHASSSVYTLSPCSFGVPSRRRAQGHESGDRPMELLFARELFKAWNSHFIRPADPESRTAFASPSPTGAQWFTRGVSEYYAHRTLLKTGLAGEDRFFEEAARHLRHLEESPDYGRVSVARSSWEAGTGRYRRHRRGLSPVSAGFVLGLILDVEILDSTRGKKSLDDVMRFLGWWFGKKSTGFNENADLEKAVSTVAEHDFSSFFARYVDGTERLPVEQALTRIGYVAERREQTAPCPFQFLRHLSRAGLQTETGRLASVDENSCLHAAGLRSGDRLVSILDVNVRDCRDMNALSRAFLATWRKRPEAETPQPVPVTYRREGKLLRAAVAPPTVSRKTIAFVPAPETAAAGPAAHVKKWLASR